MTNLKEKDFDILIQKYLPNKSSVKSSVILQRLEEMEQDPNTYQNHSEHDSHCQFDRDGGGHGNVCWMPEREIIGSGEDGSPGI